MLFVNDGQRQVFEDDFLLNDGVGANHQPGLTTGDEGQHLAALSGFLAAGQPRGFNTQRLQPAQQFAKMLVGQNFGRSHQRALPARVNTPGSRQGCNHGFP